MHINHHYIYARHVMSVNFFLIYLLILSIYKTMNSPAYLLVTLLR
jgi:hypothetical protein